ncbi:hypothetical protein BGY98DRAFT_989979 [Russula aff. rugulosa BPL654]|nr:hypothetical protein BGY98DRAFT_989979 [Russula aff. rugulosa BPL654]
MIIRLWAVNAISPAKQLKLGGLCGQDREYIDIVRGGTLHHHGTGIEFSVKRCKT